MSAFLIALLVKSAFSAHAEEISREISHTCGDDSILNCQATPKPGVQYRDVRWYKVSETESPELTGVLRKSLVDNFTTLYRGFNRPAQLVSGNSLDLVLPNVTTQDSGRYRCFLAASVGQQNQQGDVQLRVHGCPEEVSSGKLWFEVMICLLVPISLLIFLAGWACTRNIPKNVQKKEKEALKTLYLPDEHV